MKAARTFARRAVRSAGARLGLDVVPHEWHQGLPQVPHYSREIWRRPAPLPGIGLDVQAQLAWLESELAPYIAEFEAPATEEDAGGTSAIPGFWLWNGFYQGGDAELLYALLRHRKPRRVLELGAGFSTLVSAAACHRNAADGHPAELVSVDPLGRGPLRHDPVGVTRFEIRGCRDLPLERYLELEEGDVLFVDTTHVVQLEGDVNFLLLEVLPRLRDGVLVHVHDIFLPYEYPWAWFNSGAYFTEQYLLQALLCGNPSLEIVFAAHAVARAEPARLARTIPSLAGELPELEGGYRYAPTAFWLRRREPAA